MTATLADPSLWYGLALKIAMTASIVVVASVVVERSGPFIGSLIAALPTAGGAAMIILALEHTQQFIAQSAVGSLIANDAACALFALSYAALAQKHALRLSLGGAFLVWLVTVFLLRLVDWSATGAVILNAVIYPLAILAARRYRIPGAVKRVEVTGADLAWRAGVVILRDRRHGGKQLDRLIFLRRLRLLSGSHGFVLHHPAPAHRRAGGGERRCACAYTVDRA